MKLICLGPGLLVYSARGSYWRGSLLLRQQDSFLGWRWSFHLQRRGSLVGFWQRLPPQSQTSFRTWNYFAHLQQTHSLLQYLLPHDWWSSKKEVWLLHYQGTKVRSRLHLLQVGNFYSLLSLTPQRELYASLDSNESTTYKDLFTDHLDYFDWESKEHVKSTGAY